MDIFVSTLISLITTIIGVVIALRLEESKSPRLQILISDSANIDITYPRDHPNAGGQRWKFFRIRVSNPKMPCLLSWLSRQTAENCRAVITINGIDNSTRMTFKGRWASSPEPPLLGRNETFLKMFQPDPVTILPGESEELDVVAKCGSDADAFGWNNEAYLYDWRTPSYRLARGKYDVRIVVNTQNGTSAVKECCLVVGEKIEETLLAA